MSEYRATPANDDSTLIYGGGDSPGEGKWAVVNSDNEVKSVHQPPDAEKKAKEQVSLLEEIQNDPEWNSDDD